MFNKLKRQKIVLKAFNKAHFSGISRRVEEKRRELADIQTKLFNGFVDAILVELEKSKAAELNDLMLAEESFYKQKSRIDWILEGD